MEAPQLQGFQMHFELCQPVETFDEVKHLNTTKERNLFVPPEEEHAPEPISSQNTDRIGLLDTGSKFDSTNDKHSLTNVVLARTPITSGTNVGQQMERSHPRCAQTRRVPSRTQICAQNSGHVFYLFGQWSVS